VSGETTHVDAHSGQYCGFPCGFNGFKVGLQLAYALMLHVDMRPLASASWHGDRRRHWTPGSHGQWHTSAEHQPRRMLAVRKSGPLIPQVAMAQAPPRGHVQGLVKRSGAWPLCCARIRLLRGPSQSQAAKPGEALSGRWS
jgi:hypothetical protein